MNVMDAARLLGQTLENDPVLVEYRAAKEAYEGSDELNAAIAEYNTQRTLLGREFAKDNEMQDGALVERLQERIRELTALVNNSPIYINFVEAEKKVSALMQQVNSEISFYAFGERPCTHDCSSCGADCGSRQ